MNSTESHGEGHETNGPNPPEDDLGRTISKINQLTHDAEHAPEKSTSSHVPQIFAEIERHVGDRSFFKLVDKIRTTTKTESGEDCEQAKALGEHWILNNNIRNIARRGPRFKYGGQNDDVRSLQATTFDLNDTINKVRRVSLDLVSKEDKNYQDLEMTCATLWGKGNSLYEKILTSGAGPALNPEELRIMRDWKFAIPFKLPYDPNYPEETKMTEWSEALFNITTELNDLSKSASQWDVGGIVNLAPQNVRDANSRTRSELISLGNTISTKITERDDLKPSELQAVELWQDVSKQGKTY